MERNQYKLFKEFNENIFSLYNQEWPDKHPFISIITNCNNRMERYSNNIEVFCLMPINEKLECLKQTKLIFEKMEKDNKKISPDLINECDNFKFQKDMRDIIQNFKTFFGSGKNQFFINILIILINESKYYHWDMNEYFSQLNEITGKLNYLKITGGYNTFSKMEQIIQQTPPNDEMKDLFFDNDTSKILSEQSLLVDLYNNQPKASLISHMSFNKHEPIPIKRTIKSTSSVYRRQQPKSLSSFSNTTSASYLSSSCEPDISRSYEI